MKQGKKVSFGGKLLGVYVQKYSTQEYDEIMYYVHTDRLGSYDVVTDANGTILDSMSFDAWGNRRVYSNWTIADTAVHLFTRGYTGHEHLDKFGIINMNGRLYDPVIARFFSPDPFVQAPEFSQSFNRYSYCWNNPLMATDPSGYFVGWDDALVAGMGFAFGYVSSGITNKDWGWKSVANGGISALSAWIGYRTCGISEAGEGISASTWQYLGSMLINAIGSQFLPSANISITNNFSVNISPSVGLGSNGLNGGLNFTGTYSNGDWTLSVGAGIGNHENYSVFGGFSYYDRPNDQYFSYYANYFGKDPKGHNQVVGGVGYKKGKFSFRLENDLMGDYHDRWRTAAGEVGYGDFVLGFSVYTNAPEEEANAKGISRVDAINMDGKNLLKLKNKHGNGAWIDGQVLAAPAWIGYRNGNHVTRIGVNNPWVQDRTQNWVHRNGFFYLPFGYQNFYNKYDNFKSGYYSYSGYYNPFTLY